MKQNFETALKWTLEHEGGWSNHPRDPGGATMFGVTQRVYDAYRNGKGLPTQTVRNITEDEKRNIYRTGYWNMVPCGPLSSGVDTLAFDIAVNSGPGRVKPWLASTEGMPAPDRIKSISARRASFFRSLKTFSTFGRGWMRRCADIEAKSLRLALTTYGPVASPSILMKESDKAKTAARRNATGAGGVAVVGPAGAVQADPASLPWWASVVIVAAIAIPFVVLIYKVALHQARAKAMMEVANG